MTDAFLPHPLMILDRLELGARRGSVTAMVGQGIGPVEDHRLSDRMRRVLPMVDLIGVREPRKSAALLQSLGVAGERVRMTGDDAIELAYASGSSRASEAANGLAVNLRVSAYSGVTSADAQAIADRLRDHAARHGARLEPVPISLYPGESDVATLRSMLGDAGDVALVTPLQAIERIGRCRVAVTGSYHAAVFALAQGIPAVGNASSRYYADKFGGLAALFPEGCGVVALDEPGAHDRLAEAVERAWERSPRVRPALLTAAREQVAASRSACESIAELVDRRLDRRQGPARPSRRSR